MNLQEVLLSGTPSPWGNAWLHTGGRSPTVRKTCATMSFIYPSIYLVFLFSASSLLRLLFHSYSPLFLSYPLLAVCTLFLSCTSSSTPTSSSPTPPPPFTSYLLLLPFSTYYYSLSPSSFYLFCLFLCNAFHFQLSYLLLSFPTISILSVPHSLLLKLLVSFQTSNEASSFPPVSSLCAKLS